MTHDTNSYRKHIRILAVVPLLALAGCNPSVDTDPTFKPDRAAAFLLDGRQYRILEFTPTASSTTMCVFVEGAEHGQIACFEKESAR